MNLMLNYNSKEAESIMREVSESLPKGVEVYLIGGSLRNALFKHFHGDKIRQRDYDLLVTKNAKEFVEYLLSLNFFDEGNIKKENQIVLLKQAKPNTDPANLNDFVAFDIHIAEGTDIRSNLKNNVGLLINGTAMNLRNLFESYWEKHIITLENTVELIKNKQIRINISGYKNEPMSLFSCIRFMSVGFAPPPLKEVRLLANELKYLEKFDKNVHKTWEYVGGESVAKQLAEQLGLGVNIYDYDTVRFTKFDI